jgi:hypothetical protein
MDYGNDSYIIHTQHKPRHNRLCWVSQRISPTEVYLCLLLLSPYD